MKVLTAIALVLLATAAAAQFLAQGWTETGKLELTVNNEPLRFVSLIAPDGSSSVSVTEDGDLTTISIDAATLNQRGEPGLPVVSIVIGPFDGERFPGEARFLLNTGDGMLVADGEAAPPLRLSFPRLAGGKLTFSFSGEAVLGGEAAGLPTPFRVSGRYAGTIPAE